MILATPSLLWQILNLSPAAVKNLATSPAQGAAAPTAGVPLVCRWERNQVPLTCEAYIEGDVALMRAILPNPSPQRVRDLVLSQGLHLQAAAVRDGLWTARNRPTGASMLYVHESEDLGADVAAYVFGDELDALGLQEYERALLAWHRAEAQNWPRWVDRPPQVLE